MSRADKLIGAALKAEPDNPAILDSKGWLEFRQGMTRAALPLLERAFHLDQDGDIGAHWGEVLWALGEKAKARETWNRALMIDPDNVLVKAAQQRAGVPRHCRVPARAPRSERRWHCPPRCARQRRCRLCPRGPARSTLAAWLCATTGTHLSSRARSAFLAAAPGFVAGHLRHFELQGRIAVNHDRHGWLPRGASLAAE